MSGDPELERLLQERQRELMKGGKKPSGGIVELSRANFEAFISGERPAVVDFWAEWCYPCRIMHPILERLSSTMNGRVAFGRLNVDENPDLASKYDVYSIPTFIVFSKGRELGRLIGARPERQFRAELEKLLERA
ncbi:MAG: thioredoxin [Nitrososphaerota archaeon]